MKLIPHKRSDLLLKVLSENHEAVVYVLDATELVQESMTRIGAWPPATKHLGQAMMAAILLQALSEVEDKEDVSLQWTCEGPFGHLYAQAQRYGEARGTLLKPQADVESYETTLGTGILQVRRTRNGLTTTGIVNATGDVSADIVEYLEKSEQRSCGINLCVHIDWANEEKTEFRVVSALAYLVHILPQSTELKMNEALLRWDRQMRTLGSISRWILREDQLTLDMLRLITGEENPKVVLTQRVKFFCNCSEDRAKRALALFSSQDPTKAKNSEDAVEIICEYCGRTYTVEESKKKARKPAVQKKKKNK